MFRKAIYKVPLRTTAMPIQTGTHATIEPDSWLKPSDIRAWFPEDQPISLDLGCGKGRFLLARSAAEPQTNFLGIERQLRRVRKIDRKLQLRVEAGAADNVRLFRIEGNYAVQYLLPPESLRSIYIFHPDPWPKKRHAHHRLLGPAFIEAMIRVLQPGGTLHFCTDHLPYFHAMVDLLEAEPRLREIPALRPAPSERTDFERLFRERRPIGRYACEKRSTTGGIGS